VLTFAQAQKRALERHDELKLAGGIIVHPVTVAEAADAYLTWFRAHRKSVKGTEHCIRAHILPSLGSRRVADLRAPELRKWLDERAAQPARIRTSRLGKSQRFKAAPKTIEEKRARRSSANRILSVLKAILNKTFRDGLASDDVEWRRVRPFEKVDAPRIRFLTDAEAIRLVITCAPDFRALVPAALQDPAEQRDRVEPFPWRAPDGTVVEVETVNVDDGAVGGFRRVFYPPKKQGPPKRPRARQPKPPG
jgi:hypothetical protein